MKIEWGVNRANHFTDMNPSINIYNLETMIKSTFYYYKFCIKRLYTALCFYKNLTKFRNIRKYIHEK